MTNRNYIIEALSGGNEDKKADVLERNLNCPYKIGDRRCLCYPEEYRNGTIDNLPYTEQKKAEKEMCVKCKVEWLNSEVDM